MDESKTPFEMTITDDGSLDFQITDIYKTLDLSEEEKREIEQFIRSQGNTTLQKDIKKGKGKSLSGKAKDTMKSVKKYGGKIIKKLTTKVGPSPEFSAEDEKIEIPHVEISKEQLQKLIST